MGNEKRLFLLAVMTVLMSTAGYATLFPNQDNGTEIIKQEMLTDEHKNSSVVISVKENKYTIIDKNVNLELTNTAGTKKIINIAKETDSNGNKIETVNKGNLIGINDGGTKFEVVSMQGGNFKNEGLISISGKNGIGINITNKNGKAINKGLIESSNGAIGVSITQGYFTNDGEIKTSGKGSIGIKADVKNKNISEINNSGIINVESGAIGISLTNNKIKLNNENGVINVSGIELKYDKEGKITGGTASIGIKIDNGDAEDAIVNKGTINAIGGERLIKYGKDNKNTVGEVSGVQLNNNAKFKNEGTIYVIGTKAGGPSGYQAKGININNANATATNTGIIIAERDGIGVLSKGNFTNENGGTIYAQNKGIGIQTATTKDENDNILPGSAVNKGNITVLNKGVGINILANTFAKNENKIITDGTGAGVQLTNGVFVNSGEINAGAGNAITSASGNNTVYLKNGSKIKGKILGAGGVDVLTLGTGSYEEINADKYEALTTRGVGDINISNSTIALEYNKGTNSYLKTSKDKLDKADKKDDKKGNLSLSNSNLIIDIKKQDVDGKKDSLGTMIDADKVSFDNVKFGFISANGEKEFNITDILTDAADGKIDKNNLDYLGSNSTAIWNYSKDKDGDWIANKKTFAEASKSQVSEFAQFLDKGSLSSYTNELQFLSQGAFDKGMAQLSGGIHGYTVDIAAVNSRTLSNTMKERALTRDYLIKRPVSSWTQDIMYIDNNHRFGGLMDVDYKETGAMGISEKQILSNGRVGLVYGGSSGKADAEDNGNIDVDTAYFGGYYNHEFNDKWSLNSNANFVYTHNKVTRNVKIGNLPEETFKSNYPTYTVGVGSSLIYTLKDDLYNKAHFYAGIDVNRIMQGTITEDEDSKFADAPAPAIRKQGAVNDKSYYSIVPSAGVMVQNTGYIFDKKYRVGADLNWETEVGNIKDGKRLHMKGIPSEYKVGTTERENIFSYSLFGALNLTEDLAVNAKYTSMFSDEYDADMVSAGFEYKMDTMGDNGIFGPIFYGLENHKPKSDRWAGTFSLMLENEDASDRTYWDYDGKLVGGDYATSNEYKPKFTLSLNDKKTNWSYYFEGYYKSNDLVKNPKGNEADSRALRLHGEARWTDTYSKGKYGINIGYRHEKSNKPQNFAYKYYTRTERGVHQLRLTPNFTYELGNGFTFTGKTTGIFEYNYKGVKEGQMDFLMESEYGVVYTGFMPRWRMSLIYFRDDRWYDNSNRKTVWDAPSNSYTYDYDVSGRYQLGQIRPTAIYYFGNGGSIKFDVRIPLGNGQWYDNKDGKKTGAEVYEVRYGFNYYHPVTPGLTMNVGGTFLNIKNKAENGDVTRSYSFRPNIGFSYSF